MLDLLYRAAATPTPVVPTPTTPMPGTSLDFFSAIMWPFKWIVEAILVFWHWIFTAVGLPADAGLTWVLSIIGLVVVVRSALIPLFVRQIKSQRKMMEIAPELRKVQEKYRGKKDQLSREAMSRETMALYKKHGTNPASSCLPLLVQMPVFFALFSVLNGVQTIKTDPNHTGVGLLTNELMTEFYNARQAGGRRAHATQVHAHDLTTRSHVLHDARPLIAHAGAQRQPTGPACDPLQPGRAAASRFGQSPVFLCAPVRPPASRRRGSARGRAASACAARTAGRSAPHGPASSRPRSSRRRPAC